MHKRLEIGVGDFQRRARRAAVLRGGPPRKGLTESKFRQI